MRRSRVAILYVHPLFGRGIAQLLQADKQLQVTCLGVCDDAPEQLKQLQPDAIVLESWQDDNLPNLFCDLPPALVIRVHLEHNVMDIYQSRQVVSARPENLVEAIHLSLRRRNHSSPRQV